MRDLSLLSLYFCACIHIQKSPNSVMMQWWCNLLLSNEWCRAVLAVLGQRKKTRRWGGEADGILEGTVEDCFFWPSTKVLGNASRTRVLIPSFHLPVWCTLCVNVFYVQQFMPYFMDSTPGSLRMFFVQPVPEQNSFSLCSLTLRSVTWAYLVSCLCNTIGSYAHALQSGL